MPPETTSTHPSAAEAAPNLAIEDRAYEGLLEMLRDMQAQIEERVRPLVQRSIEAEIERVREISQRGQVALDECLAQIDQRILGCLGEIDASRQSFARLQAVQRRLAELGAATEMVTLPEDSTDLIASRLEHLRRSGKI